MKLVAVVYFLMIGCVTVRCTLDNDDGDDSKERREEIIQEVVKSLLGVRDVSESDGSSRRTLPTPPRYMLDLYDRYKSGQTPVQGNTVRSILPMRGKLKGVDMLVFNLTGIHPEEQILQGKFHIFRRRQNRRGGGGGRGRKREPIRLKISDLSLKSSSHIVDVPKQKTSGWQSFDITDAVIECRTAQHDGDHLLGVSSEFRRPNGKYKAIPIRRIARLSSQPFLIIFSEDRNNRSLNSSAEQETVSPSYEEIRELLLNHRNGTEEQLSVDSSSLLRFKRSVRAVKYADEVININAISDKQSESEYLKNGSKEDSLKMDKDNRRKVNVSTTIAPKTEEQLQEPKKNRKSNRKKKQKVARSSVERNCQRRDLVVDFSILGWHEWIVHPLSFNAYYCTGSCTNPLVQANISNHAVIQSALYANKDFRVNSEKLPAPCCVPSSTRSLKVLYVDHMKNTYLKDFQDMIVESCACR